MRDDLVQQLDPAQVRELETHIRRHFEADGAPAMTYRNIARVVLACGLVVPTSEVHGLAHRLQVRGGCDPVREASDAWYACAEDLRALTERGPT